MIQLIDTSEHILCKILTMQMTNLTSFYLPLQWELWAIFMDNFTISCIFLKILDIYQTINFSFSAIMSTEEISVSKSWQSFSLSSANTRKISFSLEEIIKERPWPNILTLSSNVILISNKVLKNMTPIFIKDFFNSSVNYHFALLLTKNTSVYMEAYLPISKKSVILYLKKKE